MLHIYCIIIAGDNLGGFDPQVHVTANNLKSISAVEHHGSLLDKINKKMYWVAFWSNFFSYQIANRFLTPLGL